MNILTAEHLTKAYTAERTLLSDAAFSLQEGEKVGVIGVNGMGKSTLLKILAGVEEPDAGTVIMGNHVKMAYLEQTPVFEDTLTIIKAALRGLDEQDMVLASEAKSMLYQLGFTDTDQTVKHLSGGQKKRIALVNTVLQPVEILILDEPTNHLDNEMSQWLEDFLVKFKGAVVMVTHDRYFLDRVVDRIVEVEHGSIYSYPGSYADYVGLKMQRQNMELASERKRKSILKKELAWLARGARARSTKQKAHIQRIEDMLAAEGPIEESNIEMTSLASRMGKKTIELNGLCKSYGERKLIEDFTYIFLKQDRIGIVGPNGCGKSTLLKIIMGQIIPDAGTVEIGETIKIGYFSQDNSHMDESMKAIEYVKEVAEFIQTPDGKISASALMERFLFDGTMQWTPIGKLSGGERRRLYLMRILMGAPNVLILDEPTNDLDIKTLTILEDYLDSFDGIVITVSHDRYFLERLVKRIFAFEENGHLQQYEGGYLDYIRARQERQEKSGLTGGNGTAIKKAEDKETQVENGTNGKGKPNYSPKKLKFSYKEQREYETIDDDIANLESKIEQLDQEIIKNATNSVKLRELMAEKETAEVQLEEKMDRWVYLNDLAEQIEAQK
ncbi:ABC-F family ATP-binding cassette domain-containing protein [Roseburia sp. 499]|uniref:ABC-F family ATP-binding cassette domain-containing protein n=1 Tax=Roseburia sp. 499 TaxID=1261634 RepID=UPI0009516EB6|nr:ABC-F family ATP-binding cassette domain-containing protein [Roseburia sp. 499]WVK70315.1 ABC-F family ATP-binding cassette domain-containing protein [Roseburia sp. 499]